MRRRRRSRPVDAGLFSPLLDVLMNVLGAILLLLVIYIFLNKNSSPTPIPDPPPVIILSEDDPVYRFESGSARIPDTFRKAFLADVVPRIEELSTGYACDVVEVVGHTDGQSVQSSSNLDYRFIQALETGDIEGLTPGSNFDLGAMRALSVVALLGSVQREGRLTSVNRLYALSSGQSVLPDQTLAAAHSDSNPDPGRRRIEIRLRRSSTFRFEHAASAEGDRSSAAGE